ncbi:uncharacterized protein LOC134246086 [Saccostrea cucullata]|uniref:uncharacterized protein LOC134246086 n=1 Tax=Saccostrea cuccullata TaxID=36930 RepID=UPI002ED38A19
MSKDHVSVRKFVYWPNFEISEDGSNIDVGTGAGLDVKVTISNSLVQYVEQPLTEKCRWFKMNIKYLAPGSFVMFGLNPGCLTGIPEWDRYKSVRYVSDTGGVVSQGAGENTHVKFGVGDEVVCYVEKFFKDKCLVNFFTNGKLVYRHWGYMEKDNVYATIGVKFGPAQLNVQWPKPGEFKIDTASLENWICPRAAITTRDDTKVMEQTGIIGKKSCYTAQGPRPLTKNSSYFEVKIQNKKSSCPAIGLTSAFLSTGMFYACGWGDEDGKPTYGYHGEEGCIKKNMFDGHVAQDDGWKCGNGDWMGCGLVIDDRKLSTRLPEEIPVYIYATKNRQVIHVQGDILPEAGYYPTISFLDKGSSVTVKYPSEPPLLDVDMENQINLQRDILTDFKMSNRIKFKEFENDRGAHFSLVKHEEDDDILRGIMCLRRAFKQNDYFQLTTSQLRSVQMGFLEYSSSWDDKENCLLSFDNNSITHREYLIKTKNISSGTSMISALIWRAYDKSAVVLFFEGEVLDKKLLGRCIIESSAHLEIFPAITMTDNARFEVEWDERETVDFNIEELHTWILPDEAVVVEGNTIAVTEDVQSLPVCALSSENLRKEGKSYFEVTLQESSSKTFPGVGVCSASCPTDALVGYRVNWIQNIALYLHKGHVLCGQEKSFEWSEDVKAGDIIGCQVIFPDKKDKLQMALVKFFVNGAFVYKEVIGINPSGLFVALCFESEGDKVSIDFNKESPSDIENMRELSFVFNNYQDEPRKVQEYQTLSRKKTMYLTQQSFGHSYGTKTGTPRIRDRPMYVYVSHTNKDGAKANTVFSELTSSGLLVETSAWNATPAAKRQKIKECDIVLMCVSKNSLKDSEQNLECQSLVAENKKLVTVLLEEMKWPPAGNFKSHSKSLVKFGDAVFHFDQDTMDFKKLVKYICEYVLQEDIAAPKIEMVVPIPVINFSSGPMSTAGPSQTASGKLSNQKEPSKLTPSKPSIQKDQSTPTKSKTQPTSKGSEKKSSTKVCQIL